MRLLVCSDPHFFAPSYNPLQIFSKEIIGNTNAAFIRQYQHSSVLTEELVQQLEPLEITHCLILGDFTTTSSYREFMAAQRWLQNIEKHNIALYAIPGNHDQYTKQAYRTHRFYNMLGKFLNFRSEAPSHYTLPTHRVVARYLDNNYWLVLLDTTHKTPLFHASGLFDEMLASHLTTTLETIPKEHNIIVANHFPLISSRSESKNLFNRQNLLKILNAYPNVRLYLHGHNHTCNLLRQYHFLMLDPGSLTYKRAAQFAVVDCTHSPSPQIEIYQRTTTFVLKETRFL